ncbi:MAG: homoserine dehydrogenase, partial [Planctomycetota bacterium]
MRIAMIGFGTVGQGVADLLARNADDYQRRTGTALDLVAILVRNAEAQRDVAPPAGCLLTDEPGPFFDIHADVVVEVAGGIDKAGPYVERALSLSRDIVTANKALIAARGTELFALAETHRRRIRFEAAVAAAIPVVTSLTRALSANRCTAIRGILNGTCNFILTRMLEEHCGYEATLREAQRLGYAEADPTLDVSGRDTTEKLAILATLAFGGPISPDDIPTHGLEALEAEDLLLADELGYAVKLLASAARTPDGAITMSVGPTLIPKHHDMARIPGARNAVMITGDAAGQSMLVGAGAGRYPTASAVVSDILALAQDGPPPDDGLVNPWPTGASPIVPVTDDTSKPLYVRAPLLHHDGAYEALRDHL